MSTYTEKVGQAVVEVCRESQAGRLPDGLEAVVRATNVMSTVRQYGGGENTQVAALLVCAGHQPSVEAVTANYGEAIGKLYERLSIGFHAHGLCADEDGTFAERVKVRCQGFAVVVLASYLYGWLEVWRKGLVVDPKRVRATDAVLAAVRANDRVYNNSEYPELNTRGLFDELVAVYDSARMER